MKKKEMQRTETLRENSPLLWMLLLLVPLSGGYYLNITMFLGVFLILCLVFHFLSGKKLFLPSSKMCTPFLLILVGHCLVLPFAIDFAMAMTGLFRIMVWIFFLIYSLTYSEKEKKQILLWVSYEGVLLSFVTTMAFVVDSFTGVENLNGRVDGLFQYANTWGLYLLLCFVWISQENTKKHMKYLSLCILFIGILFTGSRSVLLLLISVLLGFLSHHHKYHETKDTKKTKQYALMGGCFLIASVIIVNITMNGLLFSRIQQLFLSSSSLNGRLLYYIDGLSIFMDHPFGIGRGGYLYVQPVYQSGIYTVLHIHNEYLQMALEGGFLAGIGFILLPFAILRQHNLEYREKISLLVMALHMFVDFDGQFMVMLCFLALLVQEKEEIQLKKERITFTSVLIAVPFSFFFLVYQMDYLGLHKTAYELYPFELSLAEKYLLVCEYEEGEQIAREITEKTELSMLAWDFIATYGEGSQEISAKYAYLLLNKYREDVYEDFTDLLENHRADHGDLTKEYAKKTSLLLGETIENTHPLAYQIYDKTDFSWAEEIQKRLHSLEGMTYD